ncbi:hypothetical protein FRC17_006747 [Serendipita sp. 399]|nr:hypothetical protein FRC17_006747 [Serendipita sp. 399]
MENGISTSRLSFETVVLPCNPSSIHFPSSSSASLPTITDPSTRSSLQIASEHLRSSHLVVFPTETVYGLAANALSSRATADIFRTKGRPQDNPLIVHISSLEMLKLVVDEGFVIPETYQRLMDAFWPGPLTLLFPVKKRERKGDSDDKGAVVVGGDGGVPEEVTAGHSTVAVRMPSHPVARALIAFSGLPLAAPSANTSGRPSPTKAEHVYHDLKGKVRYILDGGACDVGVESTVVDGLGEKKDAQSESGTESVVRVLRPGGVTVEQMQRVLGEGVRVLVHRRDYRDEQLESQPTTPGMKYRHYSPTCPVYLVTSRQPPSSSYSTEDIPVEALLKEITEELCTRSKTRSQGLRIGLLSLTGSRLTRALLATEAQQRFASSGGGPVGLDWVHSPLGMLTGSSDMGEGERDLSEPARRLFDGLIGLERQGVDAIVVEGVPEEREGLAFMNRVRKAAGKSYSVALPK